MVEMAGKFLGRGVTFLKQGIAYTPFDDWWGVPFDGYCNRSCITPFGRILIHHGKAM